MKYTDFLQTHEWIKQAINNPNDPTPTWVLTILDPEERSMKLHELCIMHYKEIKTLQEKLRNLQGI